MSNATTRYRGMSKMDASYTADSKLLINNDDDNIDKD